MGYELDRLMQQFGVSTPTLTYSGMSMPIKPTDLAAGASAMEKANYDALLAKYNADMPLYTSDQAKYKTYSNDYNSRLANTSLYDAPQFQRGAMSSPGTGMFTDQYSQMYQDVLGRAPDPSGLAYWKGKFGDMISPEEYAQFSQSAQNEIGSRPKTNPIFTPRTVLEQPTYNTPTAAPTLQTVAKTDPYVLPYDGGGGNDGSQNDGSDGKSSQTGWGSVANLAGEAQRAGFTTIGGFLGGLLPVGAEYNKTNLTTGLPEKGTFTTADLAALGNKAAIAAMTAQNQRTAQDTEEQSSSSPFAGGTGNNAVGTGGGFNDGGGGGGTYGGGVGDCVDPSTLILLANGTQIPAGELKVGDFLHTLHEDTFVYGDFEVVYVKTVQQPKNIVTFTDGHNLTASDSHKFLMSNRTWKRVDALEAGDTIEAAKGVNSDGFKTVAKIEAIGLGDVIKLTIDNAHTYISEGLVSHNKDMAYGGYIGSYAQGGAVRHYQAGGDVMSGMAEAEQLIKALESGKLTENEREDAMSRVAEIYRRLDEEPVQAAPESPMVQQVAPEPAPIPESLVTQQVAPMPSGGDLIQPMPESIKLTPVEIRQAIADASPLKALKEVVAKPLPVAEAAPLVRPVDPRLYGETDEVATGKGYSPFDPRLYGESNEVATGPGYSMPAVARAAPPAVDRTLLNLAAKYARPGFTPTFAPGSIDPGQDQMALISQNSIANKIANPVVNIRPDYVDDSASRLSMDKPQDTTIPMSPNMAMLQKMLLANQSQTSPLLAEFRAARAASEAKTTAFNDMLTKAIKGQDDNKPSNAEMYFRLAAAFGAPTKTGNFFESLAEVNKSMAEQAKETRLAGKAGQALRLQLGLEGAKANMAAARDDVTALRALASEEMKEKAAAQRELIKEYFKSGEAQSTFGKQAQDEGFTPGTPKYQARVTAISDEALRRATAGADAAAAAAQASLAAITGAQETRLLQEKKFEASEARAKKAATQLSGPEIKLKTETEDLLASTEQALKNLQRAYALNPNTFDTSVIDTVQRKALETAGREDPKVLATRELENLLSKGAIEKLRASFGGNPTDSERKILLSLEGLESKSIKERSLIMLNAYDALKITQARHKARLKDIVSGAYRTTTPAIAEETE